MLLEFYKEYTLLEKIKVKKDTIHNFLMSSLIGSNQTYQTPVIEYILHKENVLTISEIEYNPNLIIETYFSFYECKGQLHYGQFIKFHPTFFILNTSDFKE